ncbi:Uncharacterized protein SCF082_LOCUS31186 [Durusdinium trenchii]|uniref:Uncharacterized protein n=1 Tax=Durusdinium trenchii TaxID=1381693 RepID=A0ABP0N431_9DINO
MSRQSADRTDSDYFEQVAEATGRSSASRSPKNRKSRSGTGRGRQKMNVAEMFTKALPMLFDVEKRLEQLFDMMVPIVDKARKGYDRLYDELQPYGPDQIIKVSTGLVLMFFGSHIVTTIAVYEAFDQSGRRDLVKNLKVLKEELDDVREANEEDDELDEDGDGVADVKQIDSAALTMRKMKVFLRACDPVVVSEAFGNLYAILMAVVATLQVKFARAFSLGMAIGNVFAKTITKFGVPGLKKVVPEEYHNWVPVTVQYISRLIGVSIAMSVQRVLSTVHTALRGARLATDGFTEWAEARDLNYLTDGYLDDAFAYLLAVVGIFGQLFVWTQLPVLIKLAIFPVTFVESLLSFFVAASVTASTSTQAQGMAKGGAPMPPN